MPQRHRMRDIALMLLMILTLTGGTVRAISQCRSGTVRGWSTKIGNPGTGFLPDAVIQNGHIWYLLGVDASSSLGPALYACGTFTMAGGLPASHIAKWDGSSWSTLTGSQGEGLDGECHALVRGSDDKLYVGGEFQNAGGIPSTFVTAWDGAEWLPIGPPGGPA